ncbi:hypothetical protein, partial [Escherichia coli]
VSGFFVFCCSYCYAEGYPLKIFFSNAFLRVECDAMNVWKFIFFTAIGLVFAVFFLMQNMLRSWPG